jgi:hypothetical protein
MLESIEVMIKNPNLRLQNEKDNSESCLFLCIKELDQIKNRIKELDTV